MTHRFPAVPGHTPGDWFPCPPLKGGHSPAPDTPHHTRSGSREPLDNPPHPRRPVSVGPAETMTGNAARGEIGGGVTRAVTVHAQQARSHAQHDATLSPPSDRFLLRRWAA